MSQELLLFGARGYSRTVAELARHCGYEIAGAIDDFSDGPGVLGTLEMVSATHSPDRYLIAVAIGYSDLTSRQHAWERAQRLGYTAATLVHPRAYVADSASLGVGAIVMAGAIVDVRARVGSISVLWPNVSVNHDSEVGANTFLSPGAIVCGHVVIGDSTFVGAGAVIADHQRVPSGSFLKANSLYHQKPPITAS